MDTQDFVNLVAQFTPALAAALAPETGGASILVGGIVSAIATAFGASTKESLQKVADLIHGDPRCSEKLSEVQAKHCNVSGNIGAYQE